jgi:hypothetical protein
MMRRRILLLFFIFPEYVSVIVWVISAAFMLLSVNRGDDFNDVLRLMFSPWQWQVDEPWWWAVVVVPALGLAATQFMFLLPLIRVKQPRGGQARSLRVSLITAGLVGTVLTIGLAFGIFALAQLVLAPYVGKDDPVNVDIGDPVMHMYAVLVAVPVSWVLWSLMLWRFANREAGRRVLSRVIGLLLAGTIVEVLVVLPVDIMIRRRTGCYCASGTYGTLCICVWALLWISGPGIVLALCSKRRQPWWDTHCEGCGYAKGPSPAVRCPECGFEWEAVTSARRDRAEDSPAR